MHLKRLGRRTICFNRSITIAGELPGNLFLGSGKVAGAGGPGAPGDSALAAVFNFSNQQEYRQIFTLAALG